MLGGCLDFVGFVTLGVVVLTIAVVSGLRYALWRDPELVVAARWVREPAPQLELWFEPGRGRPIEVEEVQVSRAAAQALGTDPPAGFAPPPDEGEPTAYLRYRGRFAVPRRSQSRLVVPVRRAATVEGTISFTYTYRVGFRTETSQSIVTFSASE